MRKLLVVMTAFAAIFLLSLSVPALPVMAAAAGTGNVVEDTTSITEEQADKAIDSGITAAKDILGKFWAAIKPYINKYLVPLVVKYPVAVIIIIALLIWLNHRR